MSALDQQCIAITESGEWRAGVVISDNPDGSFGVKFHDTGA